VEKNIRLNKMTTYKEKYNIKYKNPKNKSNTLKEISKNTGYNLSGLKTIYNKGKGAYYTNRRSVKPWIKSPQEWGYARVYSSISKGSKSYKIDKSHLKKI